MTQLESHAQLGGRSAGRDTQDLIQGGMIDSVGRTREAVEVFAEDRARQENRADAQTSPVDLGRNEVLMSFVAFGLTDLSDGCLVERAIYSRGAFLRDVDFCSGCVS